MSWEGRRLLTCNSPLFYRYLKASLGYLSYAWLATLFTILNNSCYATSIHIVVKSEGMRSCKVAGYVSCQTETQPNGVNRGHFDIHTSQNVAKSMENNNSQLCEGFHLAVQSKQDWVIWKLPEHLWMSDTSHKYPQ